ncbi:unnamed protein product [Protopolystoma xenopodis]|uniref:Uncharacterized protein n=1 Tax=Protopolystoma xenopodis TaxID=117903 RepID=A0A448XBV0_9PLAT|nr:unnamed protein product [Protopolystoma xenopodis]
MHDSPALCPTGSRPIQLPHVASSLGKSERGTKSTQEYFKAVTPSTDNLRPTAPLMPSLPSGTRHCPLAPTPHSSIV